MRLYRFSRQTHAHRQTRKLPLRSTRWLLLTQTNGRLHESKTKCAAIKQAAVKFTLPKAKLVKRMARGFVLAADPGPSSWRNADIAAIGRTVREKPTVLQRMGGHVDAGCGTTPDGRQLSRTGRRSCGRRPRLPHLIVVPRNGSQRSKCRSPANESFAPLHWRRS